MSFAGKIFARALVTLPGSSSSCDVAAAVAGTVGTTSGCGNVSTGTLPLATTPSSPALDVRAEAPAVLRSRPSVSSPQSPPVTPFDFFDEVAATASAHVAPEGFEVFVPACPSTGMAAPPRPVEEPRKPPLPPRAPRVAAKKVMRKEKVSKVEYDLLHWVNYSLAPPRPPLVPALPPLPPRAAIPELAAFAGATAPWNVVGVTVEPVSFLTCFFDLTEENCSAWPDSK